MSELREINKNKPERGRKVSRTEKTGRRVIGEEEGHTHTWQLCYGKS